MSKLFNWLKIPLSFRDSPAPFLTLWLAAATLLVLTVPVYLFYGDPLLALDSGLQTQAWVWALAFITFAAGIRGSGVGPGGAALWAVLLYAAATFGGGLAVLVLGGFPAAKAVAFTSAGAGIVLAVLPAFLGRRLVVPAALVLSLGAVTVLTIRSAPTTEPELRLTTALHAVAVREYHNLVEQLPGAGGGLTALDDGFLLVTSRGNFYRLFWENGELRSRALALRAPLNMEARDADLAIRPADDGTYPIRANDVTVKKSGDAVRVYLTHQYWNADHKCLTIRVSVADLPPDSATVEAPDAWKLLFESTPCIGPSYDLRRGGKGSRLAWSGPSTLLLSIGDHAQIDADGGGVQNPSTSYGKVLQLDTTGSFEILTLGHRNPQGLSVGRDGTVWSTEHGPQGGDEVNLLTPGENYGWPLATYGVQYGQESWPYSEGRDHGSFHEPALAFVPSIGISNLIHVEQDEAQEFPNWSSDLLVASLKGRSLYRLRVRGDRVIYTERIPFAYRIRDLEQAPDGRIVLYGDGGVLLVLSNPGTPTTGQLAYGVCVSCHGATLEGTPLGPSLRGVVGRAVASTDFDYSDALRNVNGRWTQERLEAFMGNPEQFAPGTTMVYPGLPGQQGIYYLIQYLRGIEE